MNKSQTSFACLLGWARKKGEENVTSSLQPVECERWLLFTPIWFLFLGSHMNMGSKNWDQRVCEGKSFILTVILATTVLSLRSHSLDILFTVFEMHFKQRVNCRCTLCAIHTGA